MRKRTANWKEIWQFVKRTEEEVKKMPSWVKGGTSVRDTVEPKPKRSKKSK